MFKFSTTPLTISQTLHASFQLYIQTFPKIWYWFVLSYLISDIPNVVLGFMKPEQEPALLSKETFIFFGVSFLVLLLSVYFLAFLMHRIYNLAISPASKSKESFQLLKEKWVKILLGSLIAMFLMSIVTLLTGAFFFMAGPVGGLIFSILPIYISFVLLYYLPILVSENVSGWESIKRSFSLMRGHWWKNFFAMLLPIIVFIVSIAFLLLFSMLFQNLIVFIILATTVSTFTGPFIYSFLWVQLNNLKLLHEQKSLTTQK